MTTRLAKECVQNHAAQRGLEWLADLMAICRGEEGEDLIFDTVELALFKQTHPAAAVPVLKQGQNCCPESPFKAP